MTTERCQSATTPYRYTVKGGSTCQSPATCSVDLTTHGCYAPVCQLHAEVHQHVLDYHGREAADNRIMYGTQPSTTLATITA